MSEKRILLSPPHMSGDELVEIKEAFLSNWIAPLGPKVVAFEKKLASFVQATDSLAVSSGTAAIHLALSLLGVTKGDIVFCPSFTFVATANPILYQGAEPVFIDSEEDTWNMSPTALQKALEDAEKENRLPKAVIVVHLYGQPSKLAEICELCNQYNVPLIEDAAESLGSVYNGKYVGTFGEFGIYSFNGNKIITTSGGGMLVSNNSEQIEKARFLATQARDEAPFYQHSQLGYNYRMSNLLAAVGVSQLRVLNERIEQKRSIYLKYKSAFKDIEGLSFMPELENTRSNRWLTVITLETRKTKITPTMIINELNKQNIEARHTWKPLHMQPLFRNNKFYSERFSYSVSEKLFETGICLPSGSNMTDEEQLRVIQTIRKIFIEEIPSIDSKMKRVFK